MKRTQLRSKEISKELEEYKIEINKKDQAELIEDKYKIIFINKKPAFFYYAQKSNDFSGISKCEEKKPSRSDAFSHFVDKDKAVPTLRYLLEHEILKKITVDMGAVKFVVNGADVMRPGIVEIEDGIAKDEFVAVIDKNNKKPLAVGIALFSGEEMKAMTSGKVIKNIHYVGDELWKMAV